MTEPLVCCVMLTCGRPEMAARAVRSFRAQVYENKRLLIYDSGQNQHRFYGARENEAYFNCFWGAHRWQLSIGALRNEANGHTDDMPHDADILIHWDDDDWSHPNRIAEQVALLQSSGADVVGYREMLFWDQRFCAETVEVTRTTIDGGIEATIKSVAGYAYLYRNPRHDYVVGTSLCYWRKTWERRPFKDEDRQEDNHFIQGLRVRSIPSIASTHREPMMIASIHQGNAKNYDIEEIRRRGSGDASGWRRVSEWDEYCRKVMAL